MLCKLGPSLCQRSDAFSLDEQGSGSWTEVESAAKEENKSKRRMESSKPAKLISVFCFFPLQAGSSSSKPSEIFLVKEEKESSILDPGNRENPRRANLGEERGGAHR